MIQFSAQYKKIGLDQTLTMWLDYYICGTDFMRIFKKTNVWLAIGGGSFCKIKSNSSVNIGKTEEVEWQPR